MWGWDEDAGRVVITALDVAGIEMSRFGFVFVGKGEGGAGL